MIKNLFFDQHDDLAACPITGNGRISLVRRLFRLIVKRETPRIGERVPRWRDLFVLLLLHRAYPLFLAATRLRLLLAKLMR